MAETHPTPSGPAGRIPGWVKVLLAASLACNLAVAGLYLGQQVRTEREAVVPLTVFGLRQIIRALPAEDQKAFRSIASGLSDRIQPIRTALTEDRNRWVSLLRAEPFDAEAMKSLIRAQTERMSEATLLAGDEIIATLARLPPEARIRFAEAASRPRARAQRVAAVTTPPASN